MRHMSFFLTTQQFIDHQKDVTRRLAPHWNNLKPGEHFLGVRKQQGLKKGEKIEVLGECVCLVNHPEPLDQIISIPFRLGQNAPERPETAREGFPEMSPREFVDFFCHANKCYQYATVNRIVFRRLD